MTKRWLLLLGLVGVLAVVGTASAMPSDAPAVAPARPVGPAPDIRPFLAGKTVPPEVLDRRRPGYAAFHGPAQTATEYMVDNFEAPVLNDQLWLRVYDLDEPPTEHGEYFWSLSNCRSNPPGIQSFWAIGGGENGSQLSCGATYPNGAAAGAIMRLDLSVFPDPEVLDLMWDFWLNTRTVEEQGVAPDGLFLIFFYNNPEKPEPEWITLAAITSQYPERFFQEPWVIDLRHAKDIYHPEVEFDLQAIGVVDLMFLFKSKRAPGGEMPEGVYIDNVRLRSSVAPNTPTPTETPTGETPTPSDTPTGETPTPSDTPTGDTPTPSDTPTATDTPKAESPTPTETNTVGPRPLYLPLVMNGAG